MNSLNEKILVFYDGTCPFCTYSATRLLKFDWFDKLKIMDLYSNNILERYDIPFEEAVLRIQVINKTGVRKGGMDALLEIAYHLPLLWFFIPIFWLVIKFGFGAQIYDWIAKNRFLFPVPGYCPMPEKKQNEE